MFHCDRAIREKRGVKKNRRKGLSGFPTNARVTDNFSCLIGPNILNAEAGSLRTFLDFFRRGSTLQRGAVREIIIIGRPRGGRVCVRASRVFRPARAAEVRP